MASFKIQDMYPVLGARPTSLSKTTAAMLNNALMRTPSDLNNKSQGLMDMPIIMTSTAQSIQTRAFPHSRSTSECPERRRTRKGPAEGPTGAGCGAIGASD